MTLPGLVPAQSVQLGLLVDRVALVTDVVEPAEHHPVVDAPAAQLSEGAFAGRLVPLYPLGQHQAVRAGRPEGQRAQQNRADDHQRASGQVMGSGNTEPGN